MKKNISKKNVIIIGSGPLPNDSIGIREAAGLRTHQFAKTISAAGHTIQLICIHNNDDFSKQVIIDKQQNNKNLYKNTTITRLHRQSRHLKKDILKIIKNEINVVNADLHPNNTNHIIIGVNTFPAFIAAQTCPKNIPFWADLNGWIMAESQARGFTEKTNLHFANAWKQETLIIDKADKISTVSTAQKFCTIGEMASRGHMQYQNFLNENIHALPNTTDFFKLDTPDKQNSQKLFRNSKVPKDSVVISHIGGYNNWVDTSTLFKAVDKAMSTCPHLYFISTGGAIKNVSNKPFTQFLDKIDKSKHKNRYIFLGWIETEDMQKVYQESDIGLNVDFLCIETQTGARNRLNEMLKFQLPIITTGGSEIAEDIGTYGAGECIDNEDVDALANTIIKMANLAKMSKLTPYKEKCQFIHEEIYNPQKIMIPVLDFIQNPNLRYKKPVEQNSTFSFLKNVFWYIQKNGISNSFNKAIQRFF